MAPFFASFLIRTYAWKTILADQGFVVEILNALSLLPQDRILNTPLAVITGITYNFLPFMILPLYAALDKIDPRLAEAGADLYATPFTTFRKVIWPLSLPGVVAGTLLTFIPAAGDYINAKLLGSTNDRMIGSVIDSQFIIVRDYPIASALSFLLMAAILVAGVHLRPARRDGGPALMATSQIDPALLEAPPAAESGLQRGLRWIRENSLAIYSGLALIYMFLPVAIVVLFSFNSPAGRQNTQWNEFSLDAWRNICKDPTICQSVGVSVDDRAGCDPGRNDPGHDDRLRAGPSPLPRALVDQPAHLPADGHPRGGPRLRAAGIVPEHVLGRLADAAGPVDDPDRPHHVRDQLRGGDCQGTPVGPGPAPRAGCDGPVRR